MAAARERKGLEEKVNSWRESLYTVKICANWRGLVLSRPYSNVLYYHLAHYGVGRPIDYLPSPGCFSLAVSFSTTPPRSRSAHCDPHAAAAASRSRPRPPLLTRLAIFLPVPLPAKTSTLQRGCSPQGIRGNEYPRVLGSKVRGCDHRRPVLAYSCHCRTALFNLVALPQQLAPLPNALPSTHQQLTATVAHRSPLASTRGCSDLRTACSRAHALATSLLACRFPGSLSRTAPGLEFVCARTFGIPSKNPRVGEYEISHPYLYPLAALANTSTGTRAATSDDRLSSIVKSPNPEMFLRRDCHRRECSSSLPLRGRKLRK